MAFQEFTRPRATRFALYSLCLLTLACAERPSSRDGSPPAQLAESELQKDKTSKMPTTRPALWEATAKTTNCETASFALG
ncbi:MAG: hypothetical protein P1V97_28940 [Planctomycetota bacterium]|nr:hypothetical protein [Planctomycetota bacterium]